MATGSRYPPDSGDSLLNSRPASAAAEIQQQTAERDGAHTEREHLDVSFVANDSIDSVALGLDSGSPGSGHGVLDARVLYEVDVILIRYLKGRETCADE